MSKFRKLILAGALLASAVSVAQANAGSVNFGPVGAQVAINPQPLPPIDREREDEGFDLSSIGAGYDVAIRPQPLPPVDRELEDEGFDLSSNGASYDVAIKPQPLPPIDRDREEDLEDMS